jgi:hypothetical protein
MKRGRGPDKNPGQRPVHWRRTAGLPWWMTNARPCVREAQELMTFVEALREWLGLRPLNAFGRTARGKKAPSPNPRVRKPRRKPRRIVLTDAAAE